MIGNFINGLHDELAALYHGGVLGRATLAFTLGTIAFSIGALLF